MILVLSRKGEKKEEKELEKGEIGKTFAEKKKFRTHKVSVCDLSAMPSDTYSKLTFTTLLAYSADDKLRMIFLIFQNWFDISCKLSPMETICMKCQNQFSGKK